MKNLIVIIGTCVVIFIACVLVLMPLELGETQSEITVIKMLPADWNPYQRLYDELLSPTVRISSAGGIGSGVVININTPLTPLNRGDCYVLTAAHVVENNSTVSVTFYSYLNNKQFVLCVLSASVVITDTNKDLALLQLRMSNREWWIYPAKLAPKDHTPFLFTPVYAVGCSLGLPPRPSHGIITAINKDSWEVSSPILPGNSGGPVYDAKTHEVIGIAVWVKTYYGQLITTMAGIVPIQTIYDFLDEFYHKDIPTSRRGASVANPYQLCRYCPEYVGIPLRRDEVSSNIARLEGAMPADRTDDVIKRANQSFVKQQPALRKDTTMFVSHVRLMTTMPIGVADRIVEKWARLLKEESPALYDKIMSRIPDEQRFVERLAQPANAGYKGFVSPAFTSKSGQGASEIETAQGANLKRSYEKFVAKLKYMFDTVEGVAAKRFKELIDLMKPMFARGVSERTLPFTGTKLEGRGCATIGAHWLVNDHRVPDWLRAGDEVLQGGPFLVTFPDQVPSFKAALIGRLIQAGAAIVKGNFDPTVMTAQNTRINHLVQSLIDPTMGLTPFATGGLSHVDYVRDHDQLFLEIQVDVI